MATVEKMLQLWETIQSKESTKVEKAITKDDHEFLELRDEHNNKIEIKFYPDFYVKE